MKLSKRNPTLHNTPGGSHYSQCSLSMGFANAKVEIKRNFKYTMNSSFNPTEYVKYLLTGDPPLSLLLWFHKTPQSNRI